MATNIEQVRLLIYDKVSPYNFTDDEIDIFLDLSSDSVRIAAALALEAWAASLSNNTDSEKIGDYSYTKKVASNKLDLAARYREDEASEPNIDWASFNFTDQEE